MDRRQLLAVATLSALAALFPLSNAFAAEPLKLATPKTIKVGVTAGIAAEVLEQALPIAKERGLNIKIVEFQDYVQPNVALHSHDLDANIYQTVPFIEAQSRDHGYNFAVVGQAFTLPMAFYSKKVKSFKDAPEGATVGIPNDQAMGARALLILDKNGVIKLKKGVGLLPSVFDIEENPKKLKFVELEAAQLPRSLDDLTVAAVNGNYAYVANLNPKRDGILSEDAHGSYVCNIVVNDPDKNQDWARVLVEAYRSPSVREFIEKKYDGAVLAAF